MSGPSDKYKIKSESTSMVKSNAQRSEGKPELMGTYVKYQPNTPRNLSIGKTPAPASQELKNALSPKKQPIKVTAVKKQPVGQSTLITKKKTVIPNPSGPGGRRAY